MLKTVWGIDSTKYALSAIIQYVVVYSGWELAKLKIAVNLSKIMFSSLNFYIRIFNMFVIYM